MTPGHLKRRMGWWDSWQPFGGRDLPETFHRETKNAYETAGAGFETSARS